MRLKHKVHYERGRSQVCKLMETLLPGPVPSELRETESNGLWIRGTRERESPVAAARLWGHRDTDSLLPTQLSLSLVMARAWITVFPEKQLSSQSQAIFTFTLSKGNSSPLCSGDDIISLLLSLHISFIFSSLAIFINNEVILKNINLEI